MPPMTFSSDLNLFQESQKVFPGGVNSPARAWRDVGKNPIFIQKGQGPYIYSHEHRRYVDYVLSFGPLLLGHADPLSCRLLTQAALEGFSFAAPTQAEIELAHLIQYFYPSCEMLRFVNSGTEATMSALRLSRAVSGKDKIVKFRGAYHGHVDSLLVEAGSGALSCGQPNSKGVLKQHVQDTLIAEFNDFDCLQQLFEKEGEHIAAVICEPVCGNMGVVLPQEGFLQHIRQLCDNYQSLLIFDEVMCGFRVDLKGAQGLYRIEPDLTCLGKVIGGGLPCGAYGGSKEIMQELAPLGEVYQAGTLSGNPLAMTCGKALLSQLRDKPTLFTRTVDYVEQLTLGMQNLLDTYHLDFQINSLGTLFSLFFTKNKIRDFKSVLSSDLSLFQRFFSSMLEEGIYLAPSQFEANFASSAHGEKELSLTLEAFEKTLKRLFS